MRFRPARLLGVALAMARRPQMDAPMWLPAMMRAPPLRHDLFDDAKPQRSTHPDDKYYGLVLAHFPEMNKQPWDLNDRSVKHPATVFVTRWKALMTDSKLSEQAAFAQTENEYIWSRFRAQQTERILADQMLAEYQTRALEYRGLHDAELRTLVTADGLSHASLESRRRKLQAAAKAHRGVLNVLYAKVAALEARAAAVGGGGSSSSSSGSNSSSGEAAPGAAGASTADAVGELVRKKRARVAHVQAALRELDAALAATNTQIGTLVERAEALVRAKHGLLRPADPRQVAASTVAAQVAREERNLTDEQRFRRKLIQFQRDNGLTSIDALLDFKESNLLY